MTAGSANDSASPTPANIQTFTRDVFGRQREAQLAANAAYENSPKPAVTLVICSRNRASALPECLQRVTNLRVNSSWELILVDNGSTDATGKVMLDYLASAPFPGLYLLDATPGNGAGRNAATVQARADIICFIDDDCYIDPDYLTNALRHFEDPTLGFATGRTMLFDPEDYPITIIEKLDHESYPAHSFIKYGQIAGANMTFRKQVLLQIGGFDETFGAGTPFACEDWEVAFRASSAGWSGAYLADVVVWHHHKRRAHEAGELNLFYEYGAGATYAKFLMTEGRRLRTFSQMARHMAHHIRFGHPKLLMSFLRGAAHYATLRKSRAPQRATSSAL